MKQKILNKNKTNKTGIEGGFCTTIISGDIIINNKTHNN